MMKRVSFCMWCTIILHKEAPMPWHTSILHIFYTHHAMPLTIERIFGIQMLLIPTMYAVFGAAYECGNLLWIATFPTKRFVHKYCTACYYTYHKNVTRMCADTPKCNGQNQPQNRAIFCIQIIRFGCTISAVELLPALHTLWPIRGKGSSICLVDECFAFTTPEMVPSVYAIRHTFLYNKLCTIYINVLYPIHHVLAASACLHQLQFSQYRRQQMRRIARMALALRGRMSIVVLVPNLRLYCLSTMQAHTVQYTTMNTRYWVACVHNATPPTRHCIHTHFDSVRYCSGEFFLSLSFSLSLSLSLLLGCINTITRFWPKIYRALMYSSRLFIPPFAAICVCVRHFFGGAK